VTSDQTELFTAIVMPQSGSGMPTGNVAFTVDGGSPTLVPLGVFLGSAAAVFATGPLPVGTYTISATYLGNTTFAGSEPPQTVTQVVTAPTPTGPPVAIVVNSVSTSDSTNLTIAYTVANNNSNVSFSLGVYRSTAAYWNQGSQVAVALLTIQGTNAQNGSHTIVVGPNSPGGSYTFLPSQADALRPDLSYTHVLAVADPDGALNGNDATNPPTASFQIHVLAVIAHGYSLDLKAAQAANTQYATQLQNTGYEQGIAWNWASTTSKGTKKQPIAQLIPDSAADLVKAIDADAQKISAPDDVVDVNFIGYSRGTVLISEALEDLYKDNQTSLAVQSLKDGYMMETLIDSHPANDTQPPGWKGENHQYSRANGLFDDLLVGPLVSKLNEFQKEVKDPNAFIPPNVRAVAEFYQHTPVDQLSGTEALLNVWGEDPPMIPNQSTVKLIDQINLHNQTGSGIGHFEMLSTIYAGEIAKRKTLVDMGLTPF